MIKYQRTLTVDLSGLHDVMVDVLGSRKYTDEEVIKCFESLPENIQNTALEWGENDIDFCVLAYKFLEDNKKNPS